ncbi:MAG: dihydroorotase [Bifidobacterium tibiigranuli]|jgi:dihydroorotase|uniref:dihydroorotase n=1 Tax=Bifidobacterium tibiigranuli TaxID=2172043 RepID=UPI002353CE8A|nr:dihydroorotase [Bifidobacterium tibiigranuli]MCH3974574.1 dihydroorotase [Bifidobacterium tibiigranuli]MCH4189492.1 dihydroorotase [Bifidobacterium tibiigranuli]MCH4204315.1 dihydroorotase [Bifidobacterium tibiigranuli]MCH4275362.1 dihydroorotase [Bifidobacterium tibiigranuli]MCI1791567.1 dihydroorotase [Bifidobacterium tibiigranuli]
MLTLHNIRVWDTGERIDLRVESDSARAFADSDCVTSGELDGSNLTLAPGLADPHVHFRDPGQTAKESMISGCRAAAAGGYTDLLIMPNTEPAIDGLPVDAGQPGAAEVLDAGYGTVIDYLQHYEQAHDIPLPSHYDLSVCASKGRAGIEASNPSDWERYITGHDDDAKDAEQLAHPIAAISDDGSAVTDAVLDAALANAKQTGLWVLEHCEHHDSGIINEGAVSRKLGVPGIPSETELAIVARDIDKARETGVHIHFQHVSTASAFDAVRKAKAEGLPITCETAPHYLALCDEDLLKYGALAKMNPPLRSAADKQATIEAVVDGTVDMIATDHAPHTIEEKQSGLESAPNGIIGLESAYAVCHTVLVDGGYIDDQRLIELMSTRPMRVLKRQAVNIDGLLNKSVDGAPNGSVSAPDTEHGDSKTRRLLDLAGATAPSTSGQPDQSGVDLVLIDTDAKWTIDPERFHSKARNTPFGGWKVTGKPVATILDGRLVFSRIAQSER